MDEGRVGPWGSQTETGNRKSNFVARHWRGELSLPVSYWIVGFLGNVTAMIVVATIVAATQGGAYNPFVILAVQVGIWGSLGAILAWQVVGVWRSANAYLKAGKSIIWAGLAKLMVVFGVLSSLGTFVAEGYEPMAHMARIAFLDDPDTDPYHIHVLRGGTEIEVHGGFKFGLARDFERVLAQNPDVRVVHLTSGGGRMGEARMMYEIIRQRGLSTYAPSYCLSACTLAFVAGRERWIGPSGRLGFHSPGGPTIAPGELASMRREWVERYVSAGVSRDFMERALAVPHESMIYPEFDVLVASGVVTNRADPYRFAISGYGPRDRLSHEALSTLLRRSVPVFDEIQQNDPVFFQGLIAALEDGYRAGMSEGELADRLGAMIFQAIGERRSRTDDMTMHELTKLTVQIMVDLAGKDPGLCYEMALGTHSRTRYAATLAPDLQERERDLIARVFASSGAPPAPSQAVVDALVDGVVERAFGRMTHGQMEIMESVGADLSAEDELRACQAMIIIFEEVTRLEPQKAGIVMRELFRLGG